MFLFIILALLVLASMWLASVLDILKGEFKGNDKIVFFLLVSMFPLAGPVIYFYTGRKMKVSKPS